MSLPNEPITRREMYLASIAGQNVEIPDAPITREEMYLDAIARSGGTGEGDMKKSVYDSDLDVAGAGGIKMFVNSSMSGLTTRMGIAEGKITTLQENKVDKETGKGLSTNDYSNAEKAKVGSIAPTEADSTSASTDYEVGEEFFLSDGNLYTATSPISQNDAIVVYPTAGYNCKLSDSVTGQIKAVKDNLGTASTKNSTSVVTQSTDLVESGAVYDVVGWGNKNLLPITLENLKSTNIAGTWSGNTYSYKGITFTVNNDGTIIANGTINTSGHANFEIEIPSDLYGDLKYNGADGGAANKYDTFTWDYQTNTRCNQWDGVTPCLSAFADLEEIKVVQGHDSRIICRIFNGFTANNVKFYPMITNAAVTDNSYEPYHASVADSLEQKADNSVIGNVEDGATSAHVYSANDLFIRNGKIGKATTSIAQGADLTLNTNYTETTIAEILTALLNA